MVITLVKMYILVNWLMMTRIKSNKNSQDYLPAKKIDTQDLMAQAFFKLLALNGFTIAGKQNNTQCLYTYIYAKYINIYIYGHIYAHLPCILKQDIHAMTAGRHTSPHTHSLPLLSSYDWPSFHHLIPSRYR